MYWHRQHWEKVGPPYLADDGDELQLWVCLICGEPRHLYPDATPRTYWHGHR